MPPPGGSTLVVAPAGGNSTVIAAPAGGLSRFVGEVSAERGAADTQVLRDVSRSVSVVLHPPRRGDVTLVRDFLALVRGGFRASELAA
jgi:hypothetical protein